MVDGGSNWFQQTSENIKLALLLLHLDTRKFQSIYHSGPRQFFMQLPLYTQSRTPDIAYFPQ